MNNRTKILVTSLVLIGVILPMVAVMAGKKNTNDNDINNNLNLVGGSETTNKKTVTTGDNPVSLKQLVVDPIKCIGCGKCARVDREHFEMNGRLAVVVNSKNLSSQNLANAINICPVAAIALN